MLCGLGVCAVAVGSFEAGGSDSEFKPGFKFLRNADQGYALCSFCPSGAQLWYDGGTFDGNPFSLSGRQYIFAAMRLLR